MSVRGILLIALIYVETVILNPTTDNWRRSQWVKKTNQVSVCHASLTPLKTNQVAVYHVTLTLPSPTLVPHQS